ncbi:MAG: FtsX-like permease family protein, partial [Kordiimonadaceae bacterium]|nr:FtsX-like permease family protein [Kordiimonadaceae bacterium]
MLITNYITSAWRNIIRHKLFSIINIMGLAIGLAAVMLIALYVRYETSYDSFWKNADNIYRMHYTISLPGTTPVKSSRLPPIVKSYLVKDFPEIENAAHSIGQDAVLNYAGQTYRERVYLVDQEFTDVFNFDVIHGDIETALDQNSNIILTKTMAQKYFGDNDPIGETITTQIRGFGGLNVDYKVAAVIEDIPDNSIFEMDFIMLFDRKYIVRPDIWDSWTTWVPQLYFSLKDGSDIDAINAEMTNFINRNAARNGRMAEGDITNTIGFNAVPLKDLHLNDPGTQDMRPHGNKDSLIIFSFVALLILLIASFNFVNLSTARATRRAKEVGLRKIVGASKNRLVIQFLGESIVLTMIGLFLALVITEITLPYYNLITGKEIQLEFLTQDIIIIALFGIIVGIFAGLYPAFILSGYRPANVLRSNKSTDDKNTNRFRRFLVVTQFAISISLFVAMAVVYSQLKYAQNFDLKFNDEKLLYLTVSNNNLVKEKETALFEEFRKNPNIESFTKSNVMLPRTYIFRASPIRNLETGMETNIYIYSFGYDYLKTYEVDLLAGRDFSLDRNDERVASSELPLPIIVNQTTSNELGFLTPSDAIGKIVQHDSGNSRSDELIQNEYEIIGVIPDINFMGIKSEARGGIYSLQENNYFYLTIRYNGDDQQILSQISDLWKDIIPTFPLEYAFVSDLMSEQYAEEQKQMTMFAAFSGLAIFIACLGLFGLASFTAERRTKEIGIRK